MEAQEQSLEQRRKETRKRFNAEERAVAAWYDQLCQQLKRLDEEVERLENMGALGDDLLLSCAIVERSHLRDVKHLAEGNLARIEARYMKFTKEETDHIFARLQQIMHKNLGDQPTLL